MNTYSSARILVAATVTTIGSVWMASAVNVTFRVNMSVQATLGTFTPGVDAVQVAGGFNSWTPANGLLTPSGADPYVYEGTFDITAAVGSTVSYKFVYGSAGWEKDGLGPGGVQNRQFNLPATATILPVVYFNNVDTLPAMRQVTFQVDMSIQIGSGVFDPNGDFVSVGGEFNAWSEFNWSLFQSMTDTNVWEGTFPVAGNAGETANFKFIMNTVSSGTIWENNGIGPGGANDRQLVMEASDQILPVVYFNNLDSLPVTTAVTFQVNMAAQMALGNFVEGVSVVTAAGQFNNWNASSFILTNDLAEPMVYKGTTNVTGGLGAPVNFQYVMNAATWEEAAGDRTFILAAADQTLPAVFWNNENNLGTVTTTPAGSQQANVTWTPAPLVRLQKSTGLAHGWEDVDGTTGASNALVNLSTNETYFRLIGP